jgi:hypothetical protein
MSRNVSPENALSLRFHVLSFPCIGIESGSLYLATPFANEERKINFMFPVISQIDSCWMRKKSGCDLIIHERQLASMRRNLLPFTLICPDLYRPVKDSAHLYISPFQSTAGYGD